MNIILTFAIVFAALMLVVAAVNWLNYRRKFSECFELKTLLEQVEKDKKLLKEEVARITKVGGVSESSVMSLIGDISRIENNLYYMQKMVEREQIQEVPGRKQILKAIDRMKATLRAEDYTVVSLLGTTYRDSMQAIAVFVEDKNVSPGSSVIISVQKPQVNRAGKMIQAPSVTVGQND